ncbi:Asp-tRNA(Asn)/Glu-tRNA(Gln) amidotransferase subunit GatB [Anaplasmataceae bacterium AB001_6]|nr:Asp-tRNA(Asn)/Glu-tRNA(Gln) amidotransferase subunit GatB [Anaplasmataceae bacterium AB001_6]
MFLLGKNWDVVIGLEIHAQVVSDRKLFSISDCTYGAEPNANVSILDAALPGTLPVLNDFCILQAIKTGLAFGAKISNYSRFDRKNYFYPDLPAGYQITQFYHPIVVGGKVTVNDDEGRKKDIRLHHIHLEQDAGKLLHVGDNSYVDLNRAGIPLMEIVSEPDMSSANEAVNYVKKMRQILRYIGTCDANMEKGEMRCDANVSVKPAGQQKLGIRCEIKNLNSLKSIMRAINFEIERQINIIDSGQEVKSHTMLFDIDTGETKPMRRKESSSDYRYFPDPDIPPIKISDDVINSVVIPELPDEKLERYINQFGISRYYAEILVDDKLVADYFEKLIVNCSIPKAVTWLTGELFSYLKREGIEISQSVITSDVLAQIISLIDEGVVSEGSAKKIFNCIVEGSNLAPEELVEKLNLRQISDYQVLYDIFKDIMNNNLDRVVEYKNGKNKLLGFFIGQAMKKTGGNANPVMLSEIAKKLLNDN